MATATRTIGPADHGRRMSLDAFLAADFEDGWLYELGRGVIVVTEVPGIPHGMIVMRLSDLIGEYRRANPGSMRYHAGGMECRLILPGLQSDRHPDQAVYLTGPPPGKRPWTRWTPQIVVEVVSRGGEERDYVEKREEYLRIGVLEYWIIDRSLRRMLVLRRAGDTWEEVPVAEDASYRTHLLPGLIVPMAEILAPVEYDDATADEAENQPDPQH